MIKLESIEFTLNHLTPSTSMSYLTSSKLLKISEEITAMDQSIQSSPCPQQDDHYHVSSKRRRLSYGKRLQDNARERERVHNLTAAFEALRQVIPTHHGQSRLSRLSILRIACSYVLVLGALNEIDFSEGQNSYTLNESFHLLSSTILNEIKYKKPTNEKND